MNAITKRLSKLENLARPLALTFVGVVLLSLGVAYFCVALYRWLDAPPLLRDLIFYLTLQPFDRWVRGLIFFVAGLGVLAFGIWQLSAVAVISLNQRADGSEFVVGYRQATAPPTVAVLAGGAGILRLADLGRSVRQLVCVTPVQDPVEYYYRAASLFNFENVLYVPPTPTPMQVFVTLDDGTRHSIKDSISPTSPLAKRHGVEISLEQPDQHGSTAPPVFRQALEAFAQATLIILGPGGLFESVLPNLLIPEIREAIKQSSARTIYICNLMTEPGLTTGYTVADHIRQIQRVGGFAPDYVLVNAQRIEPETRRIYEAANQVPVYLTPEEYEETIVSATDRLAARDVIVEGAIVIEADLASSVIQLSTSLDNPTESRAVQVLRHDPEKLKAAILEIVKRS
ncbi:MAG: YvcK family protein [Roseiflexaceae bacterium]|nr:YvcK family protein [Roseiflexaceae bacterium]